MSVAPRAMIGPGWLPLLWGTAAAVLTPVAVYLGLRLQVDGIALFWPAAGVAAGLMLVTTGASRWAVTAGILVALAIGNISQGRTLATSIVFMAGNLGQAALVAWTLERVVGRPFALDRIRSVVAFLAVAIATPALAGLGTGLGLRWTGHAQSSLADVWWIWLSSHAVGIVTVAPAVLPLRRVTAAALKGQIEDAVMVAAVATVAIVVIGAVVPQTSVLMLLGLVLIAPLGWWVARRADAARAAIALLIIAVVSIWTAGQAGLFAGSPTSAQAFLLAVSAALLLFGAWRGAVPGPARIAQVPAMRNLSVVVLLVPLMLFAAFAWWSWRGAEIEARARVERMTSALAEHAHRVLEVQESLLQAALAGVKGRRFESIAQDASVHVILQRLAQVSETTAAIALVRPDTGRMIAASNTHPIDIDVSSRDYVRAHRDGARVAIGEVIRAEPSGAVGITVSHRDTDTGLIAVARLPLEAFRTFFAQMPEGERDNALMVREDGALLVRLRQVGDPVGFRLPPNGLFYRFLKGEIANGSIHRSAVDGVARLVFQLKVAEYPVYVGYGVDLSKIRAIWLSQLVPFGLLTLLGSGALWLLAGRLQQSTAEAAAARAEAQSKQVLADSEARYRSLVDATSTVTWSCPASGLHVEPQPAWMAFTGQPAEEMLGAGWTKVVHPDDAAVASQRWSEAAAEGKPYFSEHRIRRHDGEWRWMRVQAAPIRRDGAIVEWFGTNVDITERKSAEAALREREAQLVLFIEHAPAAIAMFDRDMRYIAASRRYIADYQLPAGTEVAGRSHYEIFPEIPQRWRDIHKLVLAGESLSQEEDSFVRQDGRTDWTRWSMTPWRAADGSIGGAVMFTEVRTEQVEARRALAESEDRLRVLVDLSSDWWWEQDEQFRFTAFSDTIEQLTGLSIAEFIGKTRWELSTTGVGETQWAAHRAMVERHERFRDFEFARQNERGETIWMSSSGDPVFDAAGRFKGYRGTGRNITQRKRAELALEQSKADLEMRVAERTAALAAEMERREAAQAALAQALRLESVGRLAGGLAHDFNNALAVIAANLDLAAPHIGDDRARDFIRTALDAVELSAGLNRRLLAFTRRGAPNAQTIWLDERVRDVARLVERTLGPDLMIETELAADLWPTRLDPSELDSALLNLAINARDAMRGGGKLTFAARNVSLLGRSGAGADASLDAGNLPLACKAAPGDYVRLSVRDTGKGMTPEVRARATEPFFTTKDRAKGSGLGLSSVNAFAEASGGTLEIESEPGHGTTVSLLLPRAGTPVDLRFDKSVPEAEIPFGDGEVVLLVDDNENLLEATSALLEGLGYAVVVAGNGVEALGRLESGEPVDLVLSDVVMPGGVSGYDVARRVLTERPGTGMVLVSGFNLDERPADDATLGDIPVLRKPFTRVQLARALRQALDARAQGKRSTVPANT